MVYGNECDKSNFIIYIKYNKTLNLNSSIIFNYNF